MKILNIDQTPIVELPFLNAGRGAGSFYEDRLPVFVGTVDRLPQDVDTLVVTADLQGREHFKYQSGPTLRLLPANLSLHRSSSETSAIADVARLRKAPVL